MKKVLCFILTICILIIQFLPVSVFAKTGEMRGIWFSYEDYRNSLASLDRSDYIKKADEICKNIKNSGMNTIIFHVRAFSDAFYDSSYFYYSKYVCGTAGTSPGYDPLALMCDAAHKNGLSIHAWINPYRIGAPSNITESSVAYAWRNTYGDERVCQLNGAWYYNPASEYVREYIIEGVREIVSNYPVDGIHFDDYFYPTADESFDSDSYEKSGKTKSLQEWRLENVNLLIKGTYDAIKSIKSNVLFGISPNGDIDKNYSSLFADVKKWGSEKGYVDYLVPQIYFGYNNSSMPFQSTLEKWCDLCTATDLYIGIAAYKSGKEDKWAGEGKYEWIENSDICSRQIADLRKKPTCKGFMLFSYSPLFSESATANAKAELESVKILLAKDNPYSLMSDFLNMLKAIFNIFD